MKTKTTYPRNRASTRNYRPRTSQRDRSYDANRNLPYGNGSGSGAKSYDGMTGRCVGGPRQCWCGEWVKVKDLNAHYKAHKDRFEFGC